jgi:hypothetical protein
VRKGLVWIGTAFLLGAGISLMSFGTGGAQTAFSLVVNKVVTGNVPAGTTFSVQVTCAVATPAGTGATGSTTPTTNGQVTQSTVPPPVAITFNSKGDPTSANAVPILPDETCTATETVTGGAQTVSYACASSTVDLACVTNQRVTLTPDDTLTGTATITVTNTFPPAPVEATFTG